jgi:hypothetical protein
LTHQLLGLQVDLQCAWLEDIDLGSGKDDGEGYDGSQVSLCLQAYVPFCSGNVCGSLQYCRSACQQGMDAPGEELQDAAVVQAYGSSATSAETRRSGLERYDIAVLAQLPCPGEGCPGLPLSAGGPL